MPSMPSVPLMRARPSFSRSSSGAMDAAASASAAVRARRRTVADVTLAHRGERDSATSGARSPEQPSEPYSRTIGVMPALSIAA